MVQNRLLFSIVILFAMNACKIDRHETVDRDKFTYRYTDDTYLFFRNVRQVYYDFQDLPKARWHAYRLSDRYAGGEWPAINPVIVVNWERKEAYLLIEANDLLMNAPEIVIREKNTRSGATYSYRIKERGREKMLEFGTKLYEGILAENELTVLYNDRYYPLFPGEDDAENFRTVLADYYRLTRVF
jgi:hypothetical protein